MPEALEENKEEIKSVPKHDIFEEISENVNKAVNDEMLEDELNNAPEVVGEPVEENSRIPEGKKLRVTKTRRAILSPTVKKILVGGGIASVAATFLGPAFLGAGVIGTITAASVAAIGNILRDDDYDEPNLDKNNIPKNASELKAFGQNIINSFKRKMSKKNQEQSLDDVGDLDRQVEEMVSRGR